MFQRDRPSHYGSREGVGELGGVEQKRKAIIGRQLEVDPAY